MLPTTRKGRRWIAALAGSTVAAGTALGLHRLAGDRKAARIEQDLLARSHDGPDVFSPDLVAGLPEPARRYLLHALAANTPLAPVVRLRMGGTMTPQSGRLPVALTAEETLAPRHGFVWTARARMFGLPVRVRDHYFENDGGIHVHLLELLPFPSAGGEDVTRSSRGRLVAEAVWCPAALVPPGVTWEAAGADRARFTLQVDGEPVSVTLDVAHDGALRAVTLERWGDAGVPAFEALPYGFGIEEEMTFEGITIPVRLRGGWWYGTRRFDPATAATFTIRSATFAATP
jgi:hypothetical protein